MNSETPESTEPISAADGSSVATAAPSPEMPTPPLPTMANPDVVIPQPLEKKPRLYAVLSYVCSVVGLFILGIPLSIVAIVLGVTNNNQRAAAGYGKQYGPLVLGVVVLVLSIAVFILRIAGVI